MLKEFGGLNAERKRLVCIMLQPFKYGSTVLSLLRYVRLCLLAHSYYARGSNRVNLTLYTRYNWLQTLAFIEQFC